MHAAGLSHPGAKTLTEHVAYLVLAIDLWQLTTFEPKQAGILLPCMKNGTYVWSMLRMKS